jgi:hypothetical protein
VRSDPRCPGLHEHVRKRLDKEPARAAARVVDGLARPRGDNAHHCADDLARGEELTAVVVLLPHAEQHALVDLREREDVGRVDPLLAELVDAVEDLEQVVLGVDVGPRGVGEDLAQDVLPRAVRRALLEAPDGGDEITVDELLHRVELALTQFLAVPALRAAFCVGDGGVVGRGPVEPAVGRFQRWAEAQAKRA